jgi:hypothetical protein
VTEYAIVKDSFRFYAVSEGIHKLYLLLANDSLSADVSTIASDILRNVKNQLAQ